jgi:hypothetical protein
MLWKIPAARRIRPFAVKECLNFTGKSSQWRSCCCRSWGEAQFDGDERPKPGTTLEAPGVVFCALS